MNLIVEHFISGQAFYSGNILIILAVLCSLIEKRLVFKIPVTKLASILPSLAEKGKVKFPVYKILVRLFLLVGLLLIILSSTPMSGVFFRVMGFTILGLFIALQIGSKTLMLFTHILRVLVIGCCLYSIKNELEYRNIPYLSHANYSHVFVISDSTSAKVGSENDKSWVDYLKERSGKKVINLWKNGATISDSINRSGLVFGENLVIMAIGGNDILQKTPLDIFKKDLETLFKNLQRKGRTLVMLEIPLPPLNTEYAKIQRDLSRAYRVNLIPKRYVAAAIKGAKRTNDGLLLSPEGHKMLAEVIWKTVKNTLNQNVDAK